MNEFEKLLSELQRRSAAEKLIVYGIKRVGAGERVREVSVCIVADCADKQALLNSLYLDIESEIAFDLLVYTPSEWAELSADPQSYASRIAEKGQIYGETE